MNCRSTAATIDFMYGKVFKEKSSRRLMQFAEVFPDEQIVVTLSILTYTCF